MDTELGRSISVGLSKDDIIHYPVLKQDGGDCQMKLSKGDIIRCIKAEGETSNCYMIVELSPDCYSYSQTTNLYYINLNHDTILSETEFLTELGLDSMDTIYTAIIDVYYFEKNEYKIQVE